MCCSIQDCDKPIHTKKSGLCRVHYQRQWRWGDPNTLKIQGKDYGRAGKSHWSYKHGMWKTRLYKTHRGMLDRCYNQNLNTWDNYGGRGIQVFKPWHDFKAFASYCDANLGPKPEGFSIDRIDNDGNYEPGNIRWLDTTGQARNRRSTKLTIEQSEEIRGLKGKMTQTEIAKQFGVSVSTIRKVFSGSYWKAA